MPNPQDPGTFENWINDRQDADIAPPRSGDTGDFETWINTRLYLWWYAEATTTSTSSSTSTTTSTSSSTSTTTTLNPSTGGLAFGEQNPVMGETPVSWQTWSDGSGGLPTIITDNDWGKMQLNLNAEGRSAVYDFGDENQRTLTVTENRYGAGQGSATLQLRGQAAIFGQDDVGPAWEDYTVPVAKTWRFVQVRAIND